jgi:predicted RNA methylase
MGKKQLGQFFTVNSDYILSGFSDFVKGKNIIDPFAGSGDLLIWAKRNGAKKIKGYDVDKKLVAVRRLPTIYLPTANAATIPTITRSTKKKDRDASSYPLQSAKE